MASEDDLLGQGQYREDDESEDLDEEALLASEDDDLPSDLIVVDDINDVDEEDYNNRNKETMAMGSQDEDVLELQPDGDFELISENSSRVLLDDSELDSSAKESHNESKASEKMYELNEENEETSDKLMSSDSEDEEQCGRGRFKRERNNIVTLASTKRRTDIPDTLDSIVSPEFLKTNESNFSRSGRRQNQGRRPHGGRSRGAMQHSFSSADSSHNKQRKPNYGQNLNMIHPSNCGKGLQHEPQNFQQSRRFQSERSRPMIPASQIQMSSRNQEQEQSMPRKIHVNPKFTNTGHSHSETISQNWDHGNRPFLEVPPLRQESFQAPYSSSHTNMFNEPKKPPLFSKPPPLMAMPPRSFIGHSEKLPDLGSYHMNRTCITKPQVALLTGANLPMSVPPANQGFLSVPCSSAPYPGDRSFGSSSSLYNSEPERPLNFLQSHDLRNIDQTSFPPSQNRLMFHQNLQDNWKSSPNQVNSNNFMPFQGSSTAPMENLMHTNIPPPQTQYQHQNAPSIGPVIWQNPPPIQQNNFPVLHQQQQQQQQQQQTFAAPKIPAPSLFPPLQIRPEIRQNICSRQQFQSASQARGFPIYTEGAFGNNRSNTMNSKKNLTVIEPLPEHAIDVLNRHAVSQKQNYSNPRRMASPQPIRNVVGVRKRLSQDNSLLNSGKLMKLEKASVANKMMKQNKSNIKEIKLVDTLPELQPFPVKRNPVPTVKPVVQVVTDEPAQKPETTKSSLPPEDEEDEETRLLRQKIEEQKKMREEFLKRKEKRRQLAAEQRRQELERRKQEEQQLTETQTDSNIAVIDPGSVSAGNEAITPKPSIKQRLQPKPPINLINIPHKLGNSNNSATNLQLKPKLPNQRQQVVPNNLNKLRFPQPRKLGRGNAAPQQKVFAANRIGVRFQQNVNTGQHILKNNPNPNTELQQQRICSIPLNRPVMNARIPNVRNNIRFELGAQRTKNPIGNATVTSNMSKPTFNRTGLIDSVPQFKEGIMQSNILLSPVKANVNHTKLGVMKLKMNTPSYPVHSASLKQIANAVPAGKQRIVREIQTIPGKQAGRGFLIVGDATKIQQQQQVRMKQMEHQNLITGLSSNSNVFLPGQQRRVIAKPLQRNVVVIENLAASTSKAEILKMCEGIGMIESFLHHQVERKATVQFKVAEDAETFVKKYQRRMVDLSLINVKLLSS